MSKHLAVDWADPRSCLQCNAQIKEKHLDATSNAVQVLCLCENQRVAQRDVMRIYRRLSILQQTSSNKCGSKASAVRAISFGKIS